MKKLIELKDRNGKIIKSGKYEFDEYETRFKEILQG